MKKIVVFLLCITLILSLVSCNVSSFWSEILGTTNTTKQEYETVKLSELINANDVYYIKHGCTYFMSSNILFQETSFDLNTFFQYYIDPNTNLEFVSDQYDLYDANLEEAWVNIRKGHEYICWDFYDIEESLLGRITIYPNNMIGFVNGSKGKYYISTVPADLDVQEIISRFYSAQ